jgi:hypothetical protein
VQDEALGLLNLALQLISTRLELAERLYWLVAVRAVLSEFVSYVLSELGILLFILIMSVLGMIQIYYRDYMSD